jgi:hypothetical protein
MGRLNVLTGTVPVLPVTSSYDHPLRNMAPCVRQQHPRRSIRSPATNIGIYEPAVDSNRWLQLTNMLSSLTLLVLSAAGPQLALLQVSPVVHWLYHAMVTGGYELLPLHVIANNGIPCAAEVHLAHPTDMACYLLGHSMYLGTAQHPPHQRFLCPATLIASCMVEGIQARAGQ